MIILAFLMGALSMLLFVFLWRERTRHESHYKRIFDKKAVKK